VARLRKLLIANRGEIARRIARTARAMDLAIVAVFSDPDRDASFVAEADEAVRLPGATPADTYLRTDLIIDAARRTGADAVHPGYGFLSENAGFAAACEGAGLVFVGPSARTIALMASKIEAKKLMAGAGVPVLPWLVVPDGGLDAVTRADLEQVGVPILVKASAGGGGRGMRIAPDLASLPEAIAAAQREAAAAFGDGTVFLERLVEAPRHVEVQIFGDRYGDVAHLFERDCSIQRRHQKIIEEAPSFGLADDVRDALLRAAVAAAKAIGYVNAGTVEFVAKDGAFWFLEVNTRLQVEHPVTELVTGLDLVEMQLRIAAGEALPAELRGASRAGHAIEARLYAEDVGAGFLPTSGAIRRLEIPASPAVRVDAGYASGSVVSTYYDALLAKVIAHGPTREEAAAHLADALRSARIHGPVTNRALLVRILEHPEFLAGRVHTGFLERHDPAELDADLVSGDGERLHAIAAAVVATQPQAGSPLPAGITPRWRNVGGGDDPVVLEAGERRYSVIVRARGPMPDVLVDGEPVDIRIEQVTPGAVVLEEGGVRRRITVDAGPPWWYVDSPLGSTRLREAERFPAEESAVAAGSLVAPMPGTVTRVLVAPGDRVASGQVLVAIEAMKMEHALRSPHPGTVSAVTIAVGAQVETGDALVIVDPDQEGEVGA